MSELIPEKELTVNEMNIQNGAGKFLIEGGLKKGENNSRSLLQTKESHI